MKAKVITSRNSSTPTIHITSRGGFIGAIQKRLKHVKPDRDDHRRGTPMVQASHEPSQGNVGFDKSNAVVRMVGGGRIIEREKHARSGLHEEQEQRDGAEDVDQLAPPGMGSSSNVRWTGFEIQTAVEPIVQAKTFDSQISVLNRACRRFTRSAARH